MTAHIQGPIPLHSLRQISATLGLSYSQVRYRILRYHIPHYRIGKAYYAQLNDFLYLPVWARTTAPKPSKKRSANEPIGSVPESKVPDAD